MSNKPDQQNFRMQRSKAALNTRQNYEMTAQRFQSLNNIAGCDCY